MKDEAAGEVPVAFVVKSNGSKISEDDVKQYISRQVNLLDRFVKEINLHVYKSFFFFGLLPIF